MATQKSLNIKFPFQPSPKGFFLDMNKTSADAIKSDILHVLLTQKNTRFYDPDFGCDLYKYIFEPDDSITLTDIKNEANASLKFAMPNIQITELTVTQTDDHVATLNVVAIDATDVFQQKIFITVQF